MSLTRRRFLEASAATGAASLFAPGLILKSVAAATCLNPPGQLPFPGRPPGMPQPDLAPELANIDHIFLLMQENKSFDAYFGMLPYSPTTKGRLAGRVDGFRAVDGSGRPIDVQQDQDGKWYQSFRMPHYCATSKPDVSWDFSHHAYNGGKMDAFVSHHSGEAAMGFFDDSSAGGIDPVLATYYSLAAHFPVGDRYFSSTLASTDPNRLFSIGASAAGVTDTQRPSPGNPTNLTQAHFPNGHNFALLDQYGIGWHTFCTNVPTVGLIGGGYPELHAANVSFGGTHDGTVAQLSAYMDAGLLPPVVTVEPDFIYGSEENAGDIGYGTYLIYKTLAAIMARPQIWSRSLIIFVYDESGGYYDHVTPPLGLNPGDGSHPGLPKDQWFGDDYQRFGFRVPNLVISPWAKGDHVSHVVRDHASILRTIETKWNLPALTMRDANATDFRECLVASSGPAPFESPPPLAPSPPRTAVDSFNCQQNQSLAGTFPAAVPAPAQAPQPSPPPPVPWSDKVACPTPAAGGPVVGAGSGGSGGLPNTGGGGTVPWAILAAGALVGTAAWARGRGERVG